MNILKFNLKLIVQSFFVIIFFSTLQAKNIDYFNKGKSISNYFSGILLLSDNQYDESYKFLKKLNGLESTHSNYSISYLYSLVNLGKFDEAFNYSKKLEKRQSNSFESDLILGVYYLKNKKFDLAQKYFLKIKDTKLRFAINEFVSNSLLQWSSFETLDFKNAEKKIDSLDPRFENLKKIQKTFLNCYYQNQKTETIYKKLISDKKIDFSRYNYFYATYLTSREKVSEAKKIVDSSLDLYPRNLLLNQYKLDLKNEKYKLKSNFDCQNQSHIIAEILYITANALSTQSIFTFSNFYLNLAKYLNNDFYSFNTLLAENFYRINNFKKAKQIYNEFGNKGSAFLWHAAKQNSKILIKEDQNEKAIELMRKSYKKLSNKNFYQTFDYAEFLKDNKQFESSINYYDKIIGAIKKDNPLYPEAAYGRGVAHERLGNWEKAEKDLLESLKSKPDQAYVINYLAYSWIEKGINIKKSLAMLEKANSLKSNDPYIIDSLGWALFKLKKYENSKSYLQMAVQLMPADPVVNDHFGDVLWKNGNKIQARYYWNYVLNLKKTEEDQKKIINKKLIKGL